MSEVTTQAVVEEVLTDKTQAVPVKADKQETGADGQPFDAKRAEALIEKLRAENKAAKAAEKKLAEYEAAEAKAKEASLSELEKVNKRAAELEAKLSEANRREMQRAAGDKYHLPAAFVDRLRGNTPEEMEADAKLIAESLPKQPQLKTDPTNPGGATKSEPSLEEMIAAKRKNDFFTPFDPREVRARGGGLVYNNKE
jgi:hypothetical protein